MLLPSRSLPFVFVATSLLCAVGCDKVSPGRVPPPKPTVLRSSPPPRVEEPPPRRMPQLIATLSATGDTRHADAGPAAVPTSPSLSLSGPRLPNEPDDAVMDWTLPRSPARLTWIHPRPAPQLRVELVGKSGEAWPAQSTTKLDHNRPVVMLVPIYPLPKGERLFLRAQETPNGTFWRVHLKIAEGSEDLAPWNTSR